MPANDSAEQSFPRSVIRYRPVVKKRDPDTQTADQPVIYSRRSRPMAGDRAETRRTTADVEDEEGSFARKPVAVPPRRRATTGEPERVTSAPGQARDQRRFHPLFWLGAGLLVALLIWAGMTQILNWGNNALNTMRYGYPRTFQTDAVVGHHDSASLPSHFLAINLHGLIEVIEWPGGDASHARVYVGPQLFGSNSDQEPVTLRFIDLNGDHLPDMVIEVQGSQIVFMNDQGGFRPLRPDEQNQIMQRLRQAGQ